MKVCIANTIIVTDPSDELMGWCADNLVVANPDYAKKLRMNLWLGGTPKKLYMYERVRNSIVLPFGVLKEIKPFINGATMTHSFADIKTVDYQCEVPLYDYQRKAVDIMIESNYGILQSPAGTGKTQMGIALVSELGRRTLWLTHTKDLLTQSKNRAKQYMDKSLFGTITEGKVDIGTGITFATVQTMCNLDLAQYRDEWDVIIVDECHRCAGTPTAVTQFSKVLNSLAARRKYGMSATIHRSDGLIVATKAILGDVAHTVSEEEVADKIMRIGIQEVGTETQISLACLETDGTLNYTKLITYLCENKERSETIASYVIADSQYSSLILSDRLQHLRDIMELFPSDIRDTAVMIDGSMVSKTEKAERERALDDMRSGNKKILLATYSLAKEGLDIPCLERLYLASPQKDYAVITQSIGRIARRVDGKADPICYDFVDDIGYCQNAYKQRKRHYKKSRCYFMEGI